ncbi:MAG: rRNA maturation RNase YbeY [Lacunisphaera sp.]
MTREISITNRHPRLRFRKRDVARVIETLEANLSALRIPPSAVPPGELSLVFLTDPALAQIHADFMDDPSATDVITFEGNVASGLAGEICVSADTAWKYVGAALAPTSRVRSPQAATLQENFATELTLYVIHGWLHLAGYDDLVPAKKRRMRAAEARAMKLLAAAQAVPAFRLKWKQPSPSS